MADTPYVRIERSGPVATVIIDRPKALNALNGAVLKQLNDAWDEVEACEETRGVVLTGSGKAFVAGADIAAMQSMGPRDAGEFIDVVPTPLDEVLEMIDDGRIRDAKTIAVVLRWCRRAESER